MHWTKDDLETSKPLSYGRPWHEDPELPVYARAGTDYQFSSTKMHRGHMAHHKDNAAWGEDNSAKGCLMSNSVPQKNTLNTGPWLKLEDQHRWAVNNEFEEMWIISGAVFSVSEPPALLGNEVGIPVATYKVIAWFDVSGNLNVRSYILKQNDTGMDLAQYLCSVDEVENATGLDFFSQLDETTEATLESAVPTNLWGEGVTVQTNDPS